MMGWSLGFDDNWQRDIGYGVPAICDHPDCNEKIDRGLSYVCCNSEPYGGDGCGLYFCDKHLSGEEGRCERCDDVTFPEPFSPKPDVAEWIMWKLEDESWAVWRLENPDKVAEMRERVAK